MTSEAGFENFYEKVSDIFIGENVRRGYDFLRNLIFDFEEALTPFKLEIFD